MNVDIQERKGPIGYLDSLPSLPVLLIILLCTAVGVWLLVIRPKKNPRPKPLLKRRRADHFGESRVFRLVLMGKTGAGKSATGNSIIGSPVFEATRRMNSGTQTCLRRAIVINEMEVQVVDSPGLLDTCRTPDVVEKEITRCIILTSPGPHAFIFTIRIDARFTEEEYAAYKMVKEMFGKEVVNYMIIVFTCGDQLDGLKPEELLQSAPDKLKRIMMDVRNRYVVFNNKASDDETKDGQVLKLLGLVYSLRHTSARPFFTNEKTQLVERKIQEEVKKTMRQRGVGENKAREIVIRNTESDPNDNFLKGVVTFLGTFLLLAVGKKMCSIM